MIQPYIDLGWHTVPLTGTLQRQEDGSKTIPQFEENWRKHYTETFNKKATKLGGTITGSVSGIIAIDCDNSDTWNLFRSLDPDYKFVFISKGKGYDAGTLIYEYDEELEDSFAINDGSMALDFYSNNGFIYLATQSNRTKETLATPLPELKPIPPAMKMLLKQLANRVQPAQDTAVSANVMTASCLAPLVKQFAADKGKFMPGLFRIITPKDFRTLPSYLESGYLEPKEVPSGRGSEYLMKVSAILGADLSIDEELYAEAMYAINDLFDDPLENKRFEKTILDPMLRGQSNINGKPIWQYDENWSKYRLILQAKRQTNIELCFDDSRNMYYVVDAINTRIKQFNRDSELMAYIEATAVSSPKKAEVKKSLPIAVVASHPNKPFGFNESDDPTVRELNTFVQTPELMIFNNPDAYAAKYKEPKTILRYLETLVPEHDMRNYLLSFIATKFKTFKYSPVYLYFLGAHGSGKDLFVGILEQVMGRVAKPTTREFLEMFNGWIVDNYFAQLDEYGNQLTTMRDREEALGKIKAYTGKQSVQIRQMRTDGFPYMHNLTFIMTANKNPIGIEDGDRRCCLLNTPNVLAAQPWVLTEGGITTVCDKIRTEIKDFCYYLATEVKQLAMDDYMLPPESPSKHELIASTMNAAQRLAYAIKHNMKAHLISLGEEYNIKDFTTAINNNDLTHTHLAELYAEMTEHNGEERALMKVLRGNGIQVIPTTREGIKVYRVMLSTNPFEGED